MNIRLAIGATIVLVLLSSSPAQTQTETPRSAAASPQPVSTVPGSPELKSRYPRYKLEPGDVADLRFTFSPEFNQTVTVQPDGFVSLLEIGDLYVSGKTLPEAAEAIKSAYAQVLHDPVLSIVLTEFSKPYFIVNGVVKSPGKYDLHGDVTVSQAIAIAGGFTEASKHSEVWVYRRGDNNTVEAKKVNVKKMLAKGDLSEDSRLQSGDMIFVPQNTFSKVKGVVVPRATVGPTVR